MNRRGTGPGIGMGTGTGRRVPANGDAGRVSVFLAVAITAVIAVIGLAYDGAGRFRTLQRAQHLAAEAARAGGQSIVLPQAVMGGDKVLDPATAQRAARGYLAAAGVGGTVEVVGPQELRVTVDLHYDTAFLGFLGYDRLSVTGTATAVLLTEPEGG